MPNLSLCHRKIFSLCLKIFPCVKAEFPVFSLSGKSKNQIPCFPCFPCAVATLLGRSLLPATKLGQGYVFTGVCDSVHRGGGCVCLSACWDTIPLGADTPREQTPPQSRHPRHRACWEIRSTRGRYTSYWNAILLTLIFTCLWTSGFWKALIHRNILLICSLRVGEWGGRVSLVLGPFLVPGPMSFPGGRV